MAARVMGGPYDWTSEWDDDGYRSYECEFRVKTDSPTEGPATVLQAEGLPAVGQMYQVDADLDVWSWCRPARSCYPEVRGEPCLWHRVRVSFSNRPLGTDRSAGGSGGPTGVEDPLLERPKLSGGLKVSTEEAYFDAFGNPIQNSSLEQVRGPQVEFQKSTPQRRVRANVASYAQVLLAEAMRDRVNNQPLFNYPRRCVLLTQVDWEQQFYAGGETYYTLMLDFDLDPESFDRVLLDEGTRVLNGHWDRDPASVTHGRYVPEPGLDPTDQGSYQAFQDWKGDRTSVVLNGAGLPATTAGPPDALFFEDVIDVRPWQQVGPNLGRSHPPAVNTAGINPPVVTSELLDVAGRLVIGTTYHYAVTSVTLSGESVMSTSTSQIIIGERPAIRVSWAPVLGASGYHVYKFDSALAEGFDDLTKWHLVKVLRTNQSQFPGSIFVAKYLEADFSLLGINLTV